MSRRSKAKRRKKGMSWGEKITIAIILIVVIWAAYSFSQPPSPSGMTTGSGAPDFTLPVVDANGLTGQKVSLSSFRGKVVLLEFMVPSCPHCQNIAPDLENLYQQYRSQNVVFLTVAGPWNGASANDAANFIKTYHSSWIYVYDSSNTIFTTYGVQATPTFFIITKNGQIGTWHEGEVAAETIAADLTRFNT
jgi:peroxiredoxin